MREFLERCFRFRHGNIRTARKHRFRELSRPVVFRDGVPAHLSSPKKWLLIPKRFRLRAFASWVPC